MAVPALAAFWIRRVESHLTSEPARSLDAGFQEYRPATPTSRLREIRLERVREQPMINSTGVFQVVDPESRNAPTNSSESKPSLIW